MADRLTANLQVLARRDEKTAARVRDAQPASLEWTELADPSRPTATLIESAVDGQIRRTTLASRYNPAEDARRFAEGADLDKHAAIAVIGFGLGYHIRALLQQCAGKAMVIVHEPDLALLRAVFERLDLTDLLSQESLVLFAGEVDEAQMVSRLEPYAAVITQGTQILTYPPTRQRQPGAVKGYTERLTRIVAYLRTNIATTLVNSAATCRNLTQNIGQYAAGASVNELHNLMCGKPAVLVSAGPSLAKNVHLLSDPAIRGRVAIIAVQTVLKPLLQRGIRPHFVTALDYHEISARFYEDLPPLPDVTLVAEAKAHRSVLDNYPGPIRVLHNAFLDRLLGPLARPIVPMPAGSTVAHLSLYLAQHLGCDPIIMIGQDLGFSDGLYYCPGTAIHDVWAPELNAFNTVEMMEWKRIARHKSHLRRRSDVHGRSIYTDEQMLTYLAQFERDFADSKAKIIDATEGGLPKAHTTRMSLADALAEHAKQATPAIPLPEGDVNRDQLDRVAAHLSAHAADVVKLRQITQRTLPVLERMLADQRDPRKMNAHFSEVNRLKAETAALKQAFGLVNELNQIGVLKRIRADRAIRVDDPADPFERQARQIERDQENLRWLAEGCDETLAILEDAIARLKHQLAAPWQPRLEPLEGAA